MIFTDSHFFKKQSGGGELSAQRNILIPHFIIVTLCASALSHDSLRRPLFSPRRPALTRGLLQPTYTLLSV